ncbi:hypothetical protein ACWGI9_40110 [Streptomyces sp. NPDC054833]
MKTAPPQDETPPQGGRRPHRTAEEKAERAYTIRLTVFAALSTTFTVVFLAWMWGTIAPQPPVLATFIGSSMSTTHEAIEEQAQRLSMDR